MSRRRKRTQSLKTRLPSVQSQSASTIGGKIDSQPPKRTVTAPGNSRLSAGDQLSVDLRADEDLQWIWCHHGERGSSVIGYRILPREPMAIPESRPIGFFDLEE